MNVTRMAMNWVIYNWHQQAVVVSLDAYRARRWLIKHTRPMPPPRAA